MVIRQLRIKVVASVLTFVVLATFGYFYFFYQISALSFYDTDGNNYLIPNKNRNSKLIFYNSNCPLETSLNQVREKIKNQETDSENSDYYFVDWGAVSYEKYYTFFLDQNLRFPFIYDFTHELKNIFAINKSIEIVAVDREGRWKKIDLKLPHNMSCKLSVEFEKINFLFSQDIRPIFEKNCIHCHNQEHAYLNFIDPKVIHAQSRTIAKVVKGFQMPPWTGYNKDPHFFQNSVYLNLQDRMKILSWIDSGSAIDNYEILKHKPSSTEKWKIGEVDLVYTTEEVRLPAHFQSGGIYKVLIIDPKLKEDIWVQSLEVLPKNKNVVHHILVHLALKGQTANEAIMKDFVGSYLPGQNPFQLEPGFGKKIVQGSKFVLVVHYTPTGKEEVDQIEIGIKKAQVVKNIRNTYAKQIYREDFVIEPQARFRHFIAEDQLQEDIELLKVCPHGHFRAKAFELEYKIPGSDQFNSLIFVPDFKYQWQFIYNLEKPIQLPRGTLLRCKASYDNSALNRANPNPNTEVSYGLYSEDEMMACYIYYAKKP